MNISPVENNAAIREASRGHSIIALIVIIQLFVSVGCSLKTAREQFISEFDSLCVSDTEFNNVVLRGSRYISENHLGKGTCNSATRKMMEKAAREHWPAYNTAMSVWREFTELEIGIKSQFRNPDSVCPGYTIVPWLDEESSLRFALIPTAKAKTIQFSLELSI